MTDRLKSKTLKVGNFLDEFEKDEIKRKVDIVSLFESFGVKLTKKGKSFTGLCPWHDDKNPSLSIDKEKGLFNCFGCGESGDIFTLTEKMKGFEFKEALDYLKSWKYSGPVSKEPANDKLKTKEKKTQPEITLTTAADYYYKRLHRNDKAIEYLKKRGLTNVELYERFKIGFADGSLLLKTGESQKNELVKIGILQDNGPSTALRASREHFSNCIMFPIFNDLGETVGIYGRSIDDSDTFKHRYIKGQHRGIFNRKASKVYEEIILTESIIDCLSLVELGFQNTQSIYGTNGFTEEHLRTLKDDRVKMIIIAFDNDEPGIKASHEIKDKLVNESFKVKIIYPPKAGSEIIKDWNDYLKASGANEKIKEVIEKAEVYRKEEPDKENFKVTKEAIGHVFKTMEITYRVTGIKETFITNLRVNIKAELNTKSESYYDNLDLYSARSRESYSRNLAREFSLEEKRIQKDLVKILEHLEKERDQQIFSGKEERKEMTAEEISLGMDFLKNPDMFDDIVKDMEKLGYVGEDLNKKLLYIAASSRKLDDPISVMIISQSSSGKSMLVDTVKELMPPEDVIEATSLSDQALNYVRDMEHKFLVLSEAIHNDIVEHQLREMQSAKKLTRLVTMKDQKTGKLETALASVKAIVSMAMSSTKYEVNPENASRNFVIDTDETKEQTRKIHEKQRRKYTLERYDEKTKEVPEITKKHHSAQRLLRKIVIVNDFAKELDFPDTLMRTRRDHERFIDLIAGIAFVRQFQKEEKLTDASAPLGNRTTYIECDLEDYKLAYEIMQRVLSSSLREMPHGAIELYDLVRELASETAKKKKLEPNEVSFTQRDIREFTGLNHVWIKRNLRLLVDYEYITLVKGGSSRSKGHYSIKEDSGIDEINISMIPTPEEIKEKLKKSKLGQLGQTGSDPDLYTNKLPLFRKIV